MTHQSAICSWPCCTQKSRMQAHALWNTPSNERCTEDEPIVGSAHMVYSSVSHWSEWQCSRTQRAEHVPVHRDRYP